MKKLAMLVFCLSSVLAFSAEEKSEQEATQKDLDAVNWLFTMMITLEAAKANTAEWAKKATEFSESLNADESKKKYSDQFKFILDYTRYFPRITPTETDNYTKLVEKLNLKATRLQSQIDQ